MALIVGLPVALLLLGVAIGVALSMWGRRMLTRVLGRGQPALEQALPVKAGTAKAAAATKAEVPLHSIHVVASTSSLPAWEVGPSQPTSFIFPSGTVTPHRLMRARGRGDDPPGADSALGGRASPFSQPTMHRHTPSRDAGELVRAGASALSQVMDEWDTRSALYRLVSDGLNLPSPQPSIAGLGMFSPTPSTMFSPAPSIAPSQPSGEVHMDEIDLIECIGKGGFG